MICDNCRYKLLPCSEKLRKYYVEFGIFLSNIKNMPNSNKEIIDNIKAQELAFGWITNGHMSFNDQILTKDVRSCNYFEEKF